MIIKLLKTAGLIFLLRTEKNFSQLNGLRKIFHLLEWLFVPFSLPILNGDLNRGRLSTSRQNTLNLAPSFRKTVKLVSSPFSAVTDGVEQILEI